MLYSGCKRGCGTGGGPPSLLERRRGKAESGREREREREGWRAREPAGGLVSRGPHPPSRLHPHGEDENLDGHARVTRWKRRLRGLSPSLSLSLPHPPSSLVPPSLLPRISSVPCSSIKHRGPTDLFSSPLSLSRFRGNLGPRIFSVYNRGGPWARRTLFIKTCITNWEE